jgi:amicyanin
MAVINCGLRISDCGLEMAASGFTGPHFGRFVMKPVLLAVLAVGVVAAAAPLGAQSLLHRPPNLGGTWVPDAGVVQFNFLHRFYVNPPPSRGVINYPTFTLAAGVGHGVAIGWHFGTNSIVNQSKVTDNESEWYARWRILGTEGRRGFIASVTPSYNQLAESFDGELAVDYTVARLTVSGAARGMTKAFGIDTPRVALAGGAVARLTDYIALSADLGSFVKPDVRAAWSVALNLVIPGSPHTFSLQASNAATSTIQGNSRGLVSFDGSSRILYGFEFTIPLHLKRFSPWFKGAPRPVAPAGAAAAEIRMAEFKYQTDSVVIAAGQTIRWVNEDVVEHTVTFDGPEPGSPPIPKNGTYSHRFDKPGTYTYHCTPHPYMKGVVVVK